MKMMSNVEEYQNLVMLLKQALEFYANTENYDAKHPVNNILFSQIEMDCGTQARFALQNIRQFENNHKILESDYIKNMTERIEANQAIGNIQKIIEEFKTLDESGDKI